MMEHDEILERLSARKRLDIGTEIERDRVGMKLRRASRLNHSTFVWRLISRPQSPLRRFGKRSPNPLPGGVTEPDSSETVASPG